MVVVEYNAHVTHMHETNQEDINYLLSDGYTFDDNRFPAHKNKPIYRDGTKRPIYKYGCKCNGIDHMRAVGCRRDAAELDGMNKEFISVLTFLTEFSSSCVNIFSIKLFWCQPTE